MNQNLKNETFQEQLIALRSVLNYVMATEPDDIEEESTLGQFYADIHNLNQTLSDVEDMEKEDVDPESPHIHYVTGDATCPLDKGKNRIICHVCNDVDKWGAGFVMALSKKWKAPEIAYHRWAKCSQTFKLGHTQFVCVEGIRMNEIVHSERDDIIAQCSGNLLVANMLAQHGVRSKNNPVPLDYKALAECLDTVAREALRLGASVHMPRIGCGLAGGDWNTVETIIQDNLVAWGIDVYVYDLPETK